MIHGGQMSSNFGLHRDVKIVRMAWKTRK